MIRENIKKIIFQCCDYKKGESILILYDKNTENLIHFFSDFFILKKIKYEFILVNNVRNHAQEPKSSYLVQAVNYNIVISLIKFSIAHTEFRKKLTKKHIKFLSLPYYSKSVLKDKSLNVDFKKQTFRAKSLSKILSKCSNISVYTKKGTNFFYSKKSKTVNVCPGWCYKKNIIASPPDIEVNIPLIGYKSYGRLVVDGSITCDEFGKLNDPISINIEDGKISSITGKNSNKLKNIFKKHKINRVMPAELGIGLNPKAKICGNMLIDEGSEGSIHIGFGSNSTIGGDKKIPFHLDHVIRRPTLYCDNMIVIKDGKIKID